MSNETENTDTQAIASNEAENADTQAVASNETENTNAQNTQNTQIAPAKNPQQQQKIFTIIAYAMFALGLFTAITPFVGVIIAYVKRDEMRGTIYHDHMQFLIRTFWVALAGALIGGILCLILIGFLVLAAVFVWYVFRLIMGIMNLLDDKSITPTGWLI
ncbi:DUF4870 family protein [Stenoxybacter acetivorans]|uniref:DUF4870 family protein n=1 Tax=Stenoxybacter acetivorans TaxID=422441 RepID=UPI001FE07A2D|nr:molecular chaperone DnaJ [Stenoxybacter acetivorans]